MNYILFDGSERENFLPLTFTRPVGELRIGILTLKEKWEYHLGSNISYATQPYLQEKYPLIEKPKGNIWINPAFLPSENLARAVQVLENNQAIYDKFKNLIAVRSTSSSAHTQLDYNTTHLWEEEVIHLNHAYDIFRYNQEALEHDFVQLTRNRLSQPLSTSNTVIGSGNIFVEQGAVVEYAMLNASEGSIYIGKGATVQEGSLIRGGLALCEGAQINMGAKIYGATTIGPFSKVGGEINNAVLLGYSNKGHDGFLGNSVLGEWCNLGAGTDTSNLKNNYDEVKLWNYSAQKFRKTGLQFCGLIMGDHAKSAIGTTFNTGTVVGVSTNVFGAGFPKNHLPSFLWGGASSEEVYELEKACEVAQKVMQRRNKAFTQEDRKIFEHIFEDTRAYRGRWT